MRNTPENLEYCRKILGEIPKEIFPKICLYYFASPRKFPKSPDYRIKKRGKKKHIQIPRGILFFS